MGESEFDGEDDLRVSSIAPNSALIMSDLKVEAAQAPTFDT